MLRFGQDAGSGMVPRFVPAQPLGLGPLKGLYFTREQCEISLNFVERKLSLDVFLHKAQVVFPDFAELCAFTRQRRQSRLLRTAQSQARRVSQHEAKVRIYLLAYVTDEVV